MRSRFSASRGLALIAAIMIMAAIVIVAVTVTVALASGASRSARFAQEVRARALAEAGIERALLHPGALMSMKFDLTSGSCSVEVTPVKDKPSRRNIVSKGRLKLCRGEILWQTSLLVVDVGPNTRILSRSEQTRYVPDADSKVHADQGTAVKKTD